MGDITVTAALVGLVDPQKAVVRSYIAYETITKGQAVYITTSGTVGVADANDSGMEQFRGIALNGAGAGQAVDVCHEGELYGFTLAGNADSLVYLSNTVGALATAAGAMTVGCGRVECLADKSLTKVLRVTTHWKADWA